MRIKTLYAKEILDSRSNPTLRVYIELHNGIKTYAEVPSGTSKGTYEAVELRDNNDARYHGQGVLNACNSVNQLFEVIKDIDIEKQQDIDLTLIHADGTDNKSHYGANAILGISLAILRASALHHNIPVYVRVNNLFNHYFKKEQKIHIPTPLCNILNGGQHADNSLDFKEFMVIPFSYKDIGQSLKTQFTSSLPVSDQIRMGSEILHTLQSILHEAGYGGGLGDEGGDAPALPDAKSVINMLCQATMHSGYKLYDDICIGIDCASNYFYDKQKQTYTINGKRRGLHQVSYDVQGLKEYYRFFIDNYPLIYLEDFYSEDDWQGFSHMLADTSIRNIAFCGDDLIVTNLQRLTKAIEEKAVNTIIVKPNQIGTLYETMEVVNACIDNNILFVPSHRSGETNDDIITDIAVGLGANFLKIGAPQRGERVAKYNRLLDIAEQIS